MNIRQYVDSKTCLSCRGCCRFYSLDWLPCLFPEEQKRFGRNVIASRPATDGYVCEFLQEGPHTCVRYADRPFECALYPFVLARNMRGGIDLACHLSCPVIIETQQTDQWREYCGYLGALFVQDAMRTMIAEALPSLRSYPAAELILVKEHIV